MKIKLVAFGDSLVNIGFRRISARVKSQFASTTTYLYNVGGIATLARNALFQQKYRPAAASEIFINPEFINALADADVVGFSGISKFSGHIKKSISLLRQRNSKAFVVWGGVHATVFPDDAISCADAVCIGEGEKSFPALLDKLSRHGPVSDSCGFWIRGADGIKKNRLEPLMDRLELAQQPYQDYSFDIIHVNNSAMRLMDKEDYVIQEGSKYTTMWSLGCPFCCAYCSNENFIKNDPAYGAVRYPDPEFVIRELQQVTKAHDYIRYIDFEDDNLLMIKKEELEHFASMYRTRIGLPFFVPGLHPLTVDKEKLEILAGAGLAKVRMGIQSGSSRTLAFYRRNTSDEVILRSAAVLSSLRPRIMPPFYDIIVDNPVESEEDRMDTLKLLRRIKRPFMAYIYSLRIIPGTELYTIAIEHKQYDFVPIEHTYQTCISKEMSMMILLVTLADLPEPLFRLFYKISKVSYLNDFFFVLFKYMDLGKKLYYETKAANFQPLSMLSPRLSLFLYRRKSRRARYAEGSLQ